MQNETKWKALATLLRHQRVVVLRQRSRAAFARSLDLGSDRVLNDLENASRDNYDSDTLLSIEGWYDLEPSTLRDVLGDLYPPSVEVERRAASAVALVSRDEQNDQDIAGLLAQVESMSRTLASLQERLHARSRAGS